MPRPKEFLAQLKTGVLPVTFKVVRFKDVEWSCLWNLSHKNNKLLIRYP